jgi:peptidoglycan/xylan/chitin deacetylase (PgdA/CDA1 family)
MFHEITDADSLEEMSRKTQYSYVIDCKDFERQIQYLKRNSFKTLNMHQMSALLQQKEGRGHSESDKKIVLTFDDGFAGNYEKVFPLLLENGLVGNFFLISSQIGKRHMLSWEQIREMEKYGMYFGSHTVTHALLGTLNQDGIFYELDSSREKIENEIGTKVEYLTLPHGSYNNEYQPAALRAGYKGGCTSDPGVNDMSIQPFFLKRMNVPRGAPMSYFTELCNQNKYLYNKMRMKKKLVGMTKKMIGESRYLTLYNKVFGVRE